MAKQNIGWGVAKLAGWLDAHRNDLVVLAFLVVVCLKYLSGAMQVLDLDLWDETDYLYDGIHLVQMGLRDPSWAPLYSVWYFLLAHFAPNQLALYYLNVYLATILPVVALYILLRTNQVPLWVSWASAVLLLLVQVNIITTQRTVHFAFLLILVTCIIASHIRSTLGGLICIALGALATMYARPEHTITFIFLAVVLAAVFVRQWARENNLQKLAVAGTYGVGALVLLGIGNPFFSKLSNYHSFATFQQHFMRNWQAHVANALDLRTDGARVFRKLFPTAQTLLQAVRENPSAFFQHVRWNFTALLSGLATRPFTTLFFAPTLYHKEEALLAFAFALLFIFRFKTVRQNIKQRPVILLALASAWGVALLSTLLSMPRTDFMFLPVALGLTLIVLLLAGGTATRYPALWQIGVVGLILVALVPSVGDLLPHRTPNVATVRFGMQLQLDKPVIMFAPNGMPGDYFLDDVTYFPDSEPRDQSFESFMQEYKVNLILVTPELVQYLNDPSTPGWTEFFAEPEKYGFVQYDVPETDRKLLVARSLLRQ